MNTNRLLDTDFKDFFSSYVEALLWSSTDTDAQGSEICFDEYDPSEDFLCEAEKTCKLFLNKHLGNIKLAINASKGYSFAQAGHDFALTRNGHGAGFWDRGLGHVGEVLSEDCGNSGAFKPVHPYLNTNNQVEVEVFK